MLAIVKHMYIDQAILKYTLSGEIIYYDCALNFKIFSLKKPGRLCSPASFYYPGVPLTILWKYYSVLQTKM